MTADEPSSPPRRPEGQRTIDERTEDYRLPSLENRPKPPYIDAVRRETLRWALTYENWTVSNWVQIGGILSNHLAANSNLPSTFLFFFIVSWFSSRSPSHPGGFLPTMEVSSRNDRYWEFPVWPPLLTIALGLISFEAYVARWGDEYQCLWMSTPTIHEYQ